MRGNGALQVELQAQPEQDALQRHEDEHGIALYAPAPQVHHRDGHLQPTRNLSSPNDARMAHS